MLWGPRHQKRAAGAKPASSGGLSAVVSQPAPAIKPVGRPPEWRGRNPLQSTWPRQIKTAGNMPYECPGAETQGLGWTYQSDRGPGRVVPEVYPSALGSQRLATVGCCSCLPGSQNGGGRIAKTLGKTHFGSPCGGRGSSAVPCQRSGSLDTATRGRGRGERVPERGGFPMVAAKPVDEAAASFCCQNNGVGILQLAIRHGWLVEMRPPTCPSQPGVAP